MYILCQILKVSQDETRERRKDINGMSFNCIVQGDEELAHVRPQSKVGQYRSLTIFRHGRGKEC